jgi:hypothetical protein
MFALSTLQETPKQLINYCKIRLKMDAQGVVLIEVEIPTLRVG